MTTKKQVEIPDTIQKRNDWFETLINELKTDNFILNEGIASPETIKKYEILMRNDEDELFGLSRQLSSNHFIKKMIFEYISEIKNRKVNFNKLAFDLGNSKLLSWVEIDDNDETSEDNLILAEAKVNSKYINLGFHVTSTIIESGDNIPVPSHFNVIK
jgi:hypothetical protein